MVKQVETLRESVASGAKGSSMSLDDIYGVGQMFMDQASPNQARRMQRLLNKASDLGEYARMSDQIEAAAEMLDAHYGDFQAVLTDTEACAGHMRHLFSEERFVPFRYAADDVYRAFEHVGYPQWRPESRRQDTEIFEAAILHLADEDYRFRTALRLMTMLPEYVAEQQYLEAWLIEYSALQMIEVPDQGNPFLVEMLHHGIMEWEDEMEAQREAVLGLVGVDANMLAGMSADEMDEYVQGPLTDPATSVKLEEFYAANPMMSAQAHAEFAHLQRNAIGLLQRDDAQRLCLSSQECEPWLPALMQCVKAFEEQHRGLQEKADPDSSGALEGLRDILLELAKEMAPVVFTPDRVKRLVADLREYRQVMREAGDWHGAKCASVAMMTLQQEHAAAHAPLLVVICCTSLGLELDAIVERARNSVDRDEASKDTARS